MATEKRLLEQRAYLAQFGTIVDDPDKATQTFKGRTGKPVLKVKSWHSRAMDARTIRYSVTLTRPLLAFKKVLVPNNGKHFTRDLAPKRAIATLLLPIGTTIICGGDGDMKLRADQAMVVDVTNTTGSKRYPFGAALRGYSFKYIPGETVTPEYQFGKQYKTCASGIHFFIDKKNAKSYPG